MADRKLNIAFWNYDRGQALREKAVKIDGVDGSFHSGTTVVDIFKAMVKDHAYDVAELGFTYFLRTMDQPDPPFLALPIFLVRSFRHSAIYINKTKGIRHPTDLAGKRIGELALYGHDAGVMPKGMLSDEVGFNPATCSWVIGGIDFPLEPIDWLAKPVPAGIDVTYAPPGADLGEMLLTGELDALIAADAPKCVLENHPDVGRLFEDYETIERDYYRRTGIFPIMHLVAVKQELAQDRGLMRAIYRGFCESKAQAQGKLVKGMTFNNMTVMIPWLSNLISRDRELLGDDWWPYGIGRNRQALDAYLRYHHEQGLSKRRMTLEDVFVPSLLDT